MEEEKNPKGTCERIVNIITILLVIALIPYIILSLCDVISNTVNIKNPYEQLKESKQLDFLYSGRTIFRPAAIMF